MQGSFKDIVKDLLNKDDKPEVKPSVTPAEPVISQENPVLPKSPMYKHPDGREEQSHSQHFHWKKYTGGRKQMTVAWPTELYKMFGIHSGNSYTLVGNVKINLTGWDKDLGGCRPKFKHEGMAAGDFPNNVQVTLYVDGIARGGCRIGITDMDHTEYLPKTFDGVI